jgi:hypothetical protein
MSTIVAIEFRSARLLIGQRSYNCVFRRDQKHIRRFLEGANGGLVVREPETLEKELEIFEQHRDEWSKTQPGKYVAIQDDTVVEGFFSTYAEALKAGLRKFGVRRCFLVKQVWDAEPVYFVS